jgi:hypothetical protein
MSKMNDEPLDRFVPERWLEPDVRMKLFWKMQMDSGAVVPASGSDWLSLTSMVAVQPPTPTRIINLFEQARACAAYGYFFYPLYSLAVEQVVRVADAAVAVKCEMLAAPRSQTDRFARRIDWLAKHGSIADFSAESWHHLRAWRNELTHQTRPTILTPAMVAPLFDSVARDIQALFSTGSAT